MIAAGVDLTKTASIGVHYQRSGKNGRTDSLGRSTADMNYDPPHIISVGNYAMFAAFRNGGSNPHGYRK